MKVKLPTEEKQIDKEIERGPEEDQNQDVLPADEIPADEKENEEIPLEEESAKPTALELKIAHLEGKIDGMASASAKPAPGTSQEERDMAAKNQCLADMAALDDDSFTQKYRMNKLQANNAIHDFERNKEKTHNATRIAELEAKNDLLAKYPSIGKHFDKLKQTVKSELSQEAQQDPERLRRAIEKEFLLIEKETTTPPAKKKTQEDPMRRKIVNDFERPNGDPDRSSKERAGKDELAPELVEVGKRFGITSESQRKKFMSPFIPMELGGGYRFEDPKRGFEKVVQK